MLVDYIVQISYILDDFLSSGSIRYWKGKIKVSNYNGNFSLSFSSASLCITYFEILLSGNTHLGSLYHPGRLILLSFCNIVFVCNNFLCSKVYTYRYWHSHMYFLLKFVCYISIPLLSTYLCHWILREFLINARQLNSVFLKCPLPFCLLISIFIPITFRVIDDILAFKPAILLFLLYLSPLTFIPIYFSLHLHGLLKLVLEFHLDLFIVCLSIPFYIFFVGVCWVLQLHHMNYQCLLVRTFYHFKWTMENSLPFMFLSLPIFNIMAVSDGIIVFGFNL